MHVVFDLGGVVFRWRPHELVRRVLPRRTGTEAATAALVADFFQGYGGDWDQFDRGILEEDALAERIAARTGLAGAEVRAVIDAVAGELQPVPATAALIERLREGGHRVHYLSNMPAPYARHVCATHAVMRAFEGGVFSSEVHLVKPEPAIFHAAQERFGAAPGELLFVDDHALNVTAARAAGWSALRFLSPQQCEDELRQLGLLS